MRVSQTTMQKIHKMNLTKIFLTLIFLSSFSIEGLAKKSVVDQKVLQKLEIILPENPSVVEQTAASELANYLEKIYGREFFITPEVDVKSEGIQIFVGRTDFARDHGVIVDDLESEEWLVRSVDKNLIVIGGGSRGTLYGIYHYLEDVLGVRWWNPWEESIPNLSEIPTTDLDLQGKPAFRYRAIAYTYAFDGGRFSARNRLNRDAHRKISPEYGGEFGYGPPYSVHTFNHYFPPSQYFAKHPEWYGVRDGKRVDNGQLCLTNRELREAFLEKLIHYIEDSHSSAISKEENPPVVFNVSQNDGGMATGCECEQCQAIVEAEGAESGVLLNFINYLADGVKESYPEVYIETLAYLYSEPPPNHVRPRDNVIIMLCDTTSDLLKPIPAEENRIFRDMVKEWSKISDHLFVWDYAITFSHPIGLPMPTVQTYAEDHRFFAEHHVQGIFTELEYPVRADMRDLKVWTLIKIMEDPYADLDELVYTFTEGFYGPAGKYIREYLDLLETEALKAESRVGWFSMLTNISYLNHGFVYRAHEVFDQAKHVVEGDEILTRRVSHARLPLDRATLAAYGRLNAEWQNLGSNQDTVLLDRNIIAERVLATWLDYAEQRIPKNLNLYKTEIEAAHKEIETYLSLPEYISNPQKFSQYPRNSVYDFTGETMKLYGNRAQIVEDKEAESGFTVRLELEHVQIKNPDRYALPMPWGIYGAVDKVTRAGTSIHAKEIPGPGYHWYKVGRFSIRPGDYLFFFWSWIIQVELDSVYDSNNPNDEFDIWVRLKFEGPLFPHGHTEQVNAINVERVVLVRDDLKSGETQ